MRNRQNKKLLETLLEIADRRSPNNRSKHDSIFFGEKDLTPTNNKPILGSFMK